MSWEVWVWVLIVWNIIGCVILIAASGTSDEGALNKSQGWEFVNPIYIYKHNRVNWFGALVVAIIYNALCPVGAVIYWFYKLCTVGRD